MTAIANASLRAAVTAIAPVILLGGFVYHPYIHNLPDPAAVAAAAQQGTFRWGLAHLAIGVGSAFIAVAFLAIRSYLREAGEDRWSAMGLPFIVLGSTLYAILPGMEFTVLAAVEIGADVAAAQAALDAWFLPLLLTGAVVFAIGALGFAMAIGPSGVLSPRLTRLVVGALVVMAAARFVPLGLVQFYVGGAAAVLAMWPLAHGMWKHALARPKGQPRSMPAT